MENNITGTNKISDLPDVLLTHILSFVSPIEAVQTCILSKRWRCTWASVPVLKFYLEKFVPAYEISSSKIRELQLHENETRMGEYHIKLKKFVKRVLQNRERSLSLDTFKLRLDFVCNQQYYYTYPFSIKCIVLALKFKPRVFSVHVHWHVLLDLYCIEPIFTCASLQKISLELKCLNLAKVFLQLRTVNLPRLKRLKLSYVGVDDNFLKMLFLGCPALEELKLSSCHLHASLLFSEVVKSLVLECCYFEKNLVIYTPRLMYLDIYHTQHDGRKFSLENMTSLVDAQIECFSVHDDAGLILCNHVSIFSMSDQSAALAKVMRKEVPNMQNFKNLKSLQLGGDRSNIFNLVAIFLHISPNLRKLCLRVYPPYWSNIEEKSSKEKSRDVLPLREYLEEVEIISYYNAGEEIVGQVIKKLSAHVKTIGKIILKKSSILDELS